MFTSITPSEISPDFFVAEAKKRSDVLMNYFLLGYFAMGLVFATFYGTWVIAIGVGGLSVIAYYSAKLALPGSDLYQYVLSVVLGIFMAQFIYQMHGLFEVHFFAFIASAVLITFQKWKLQIPLALTVFIHHAAFSYLQDTGFTKIYFTQLDYFEVQTFIIHILLTCAIFFICGLWAYQLKKYNQIHITQTLKVAELEREALKLQAQKQKAESLEERDAILESIGDAFFAIDKDFTITYWNKKAEEIMKQQKDEVIGQNLWVAFPDAVNRFFYPYFAQALTDNTAIQFEARYLGLTDWYEIKIYPSKNGLSVFIKDISDRKSSELELTRLNASLHQQTKELAISNEELEQFAYVTSHDLQEPLRMITSFMGLLDKKYGHLIDEKGKQYIHFAIDGGKRMRQIILDLLAYSRVGRTSEQLEDIDLNKLIDEIGILHRKAIMESNAHISFNNLPLLQCTKAPLLQVFQNLISNALKYKRPGVAPEVSISSMDCGSHWQFAVSDNGIGIDAEYFDSIFIIFRRLHTNEDYHGTGMGLTVTKKIIESLGGKIWVESNNGEGSTFHFTISKNFKNINA